MASERYFVRDGDRDKGPYTLRQLREAVAATAIAEDALVHAEGQEATRPLGEVLREARGARQASAAPPARREESRKPRAAGRPTASHDVYAPPGDDGLAAGDDGYVPDAGSYWKGFALGFFFGCIALLLSSRSRSETRRGITHGFAVAAALTVIRIALEASVRHR